MDTGEQSASTLLEGIYAEPSDDEEAEVLRRPEPESQGPSFVGVFRPEPATPQTCTEPAARPTPQQGMMFSNLIHREQRAHPLNIKILLSRSKWVTTSSVPIHPFIEI